jgi:hypothetical protein
MWNAKRLGHAQDGIETRMRYGDEPMTRLLSNHCERSFQPYPTDND